MQSGRDEKLVQFGFERQNDSQLKLVNNHITAIMVCCIALFSPLSPLLSYYII